MMIFQNSWKSSQCQHEGCGLAPATWRILQARWAFPGNGTYQNFLFNTLPIFWKVLGLSDHRREAQRRPIHEHFQPVLVQVLYVQVAYSRGWEKRLFQHEEISQFFRGESPILWRSSCSFVQSGRIMGKSQNYPFIIKSVKPDILVPLCTGQQY